MTKTINPVVPVNFSGRIVIGIAAENVKVTIVVKICPCCKTTVE